MEPISVEVSEDGSVSSGPEAIIAEDAEVCLVEVGAPHLGPRPAKFAVDKIQDAYFFELKKSDRVVERMLSGWHC